MHHIWFEQTNVENTSGTVGKFEYVLGIIDALNIDIKKLLFVLWLVWLSGLSASLRTKGSLVQFPVRAHAWVAEATTH